jgi:hypothetical protein
MRSQKESGGAREALSHCPPTTSLFVGSLDPTHLATKTKFRSQQKDSILQGLGTHSVSTTCHVTSFEHHYVSKT